MSYRCEGDVFDADFAKRLNTLIDETPSLSTYGYSPVYLHFRYKTKQEGLEKHELYRQELREAAGRVKRTHDWLLDHITPIKTLCQTRSSYGMKHTVEKYINYITNGEFIAAALLAGYKMKCRHNSPNPHFAMSVKDWRQYEHEALVDKPIKPIWLKDKGVSNNLPDTP